MVDTFKELCFETTVDFKGGEFYDGVEAAVSLRYEKLFGFCKICASLCHKEDLCPLDVKNSKSSPEQRRETREGTGGWSDGAQHDDRARSYKGMVINGNMGTEDVRLPSAGFQIELAKTQAEATEVIMEVTNEEKGSLGLQGMVEKQDELTDDVVKDIDMEMDAITATLLESGVDMEAEDQFQTLSEEEAEQASGAQIVHAHAQEDEELVNGDVDINDDTGAGDLVTRQRTRKRLFKPTISTTGSNKMRMASALVSPRKRAAAKAGPRHGDSSKPLESKGPSHPKPANLKF